MDLKLRYDSIDSLKELYEMKLSKYPCERLCDIVIKINILDDVEALKRNGKFEDAYVKVMKYLNICSFIQKKSDDKAYVKLIIGKEYKEAIKIAEELKDELQKRYAERKSIKSSECKAFVTSEMIPETTVNGTIENPNSLDIVELNSLILKNDNILIMDVRDPEEFQQCHIKFDQIINIPREVCVPGCTIRKVESKLSTYAGYWESRNSFAQIIVMDGNDDGSAETLANTLRNYDEKRYENKIKPKIRVLEKGFVTFAESYFWLLTNPLPIKETPHQKPFDAIAAIEFPNFDVEQESAKPFFSRDNKPKISKIDASSTTTPLIDRKNKTAAARKFEERVELLRRRNDEVTAVLEVEKERIARERELQDSLQKQKLAANEEQRLKLEQQSTELLMEIEELKNRSSMKDETINELRAELEYIKSKKEDEVAKRLEALNVEDEEKQQLEESLLEQETRRNEEEIEKLKRESASLEQHNAERKRLEEAARRKLLVRPNVPTIDRSSKPVVAYKEKYRDFAPVYDKVSPGLTGLKNIGNTCYMNSILQCMSNNNEIAEYFCRKHYRDHVNRTHKTKGEIAEEVAAVVSALWSGQYRFVACKDFRITVGAMKSEYGTFEQQDSHEFLTYLMNWLHDDLKISYSINPSLQQPELEKVWDSLMAKNYSLIWRLFYGLQKSTVRCYTCGETSTTYEPFSNLSLSIPDYSDVSLKDCLRLYLKEESISGWKCPKCKDERRAEKKTELCKLPPILVIHLNRFSFLDIHSKKKTTFVDFPLEGLQLSCSSSDPDKIYNLYAVSNHYGTMQGGHYTAYCKNCLLKKWHKFDDHEVIPISPSEVKSSAAYILFYSARSHDS